MSSNSKAISIVLSALLHSSLFANDVNQTKMLKPLTVTATKTKENLQNIPISVSVIDRFDIDDNNFKTLSDISKIIPNFTSVNSGMDLIYMHNIRGLYTDPESLSSIIGTYVDGIPYNSFGNNIELENIERIEVLRGPQSTLYGKYAYAGAINIITKKPTNHTEGTLRLTLGEDNKRQFNFHINTPIIQDKFFIGISGRHYEKDGYIKNIYLNKDDNYKEDDFAKLYLRFLPIENLELSLISTYFQKNDGGFNMNSMANKNPRENTLDIQGFTKPKGHAHAFKIKYNYNNINFTSISTYKVVKPNRLIDFDGTPKQIMHAGQKGKFKDYSQEFRLDGRGGNLKWLTGLMLDKKEESPINFSNGKIFSKNKTTQQGIGVFANIDYDINDKLTLTGGLRYDKDKAKVHDLLNGFKDTANFDAFSPKIGVKYAINQNISSYFTIAKGYKSGGFFMFAPSGKRKYGKESLLSYEMGIKTKSFNDRLLFNVSAFYMDIKDMQVRTDLSPLVSYMSNASTATSKGFEVESILRATNEIDIFANLGYTHSEYDNFSDELGNYSGNMSQFSPKFDYSAGVSYRDTLGIFAKFSISGQSSFYTDKANKFKNKGYALLDAKIGYEKDNFEVYLYCDNITDKKHDVTGFFDMYNVVSKPREFGIQLAYKF